MAQAELEEELRRRIARRGAITFAEFQQECLYSPLGGFYSGRTTAINAHFHTSPTSHQLFGTLLAVQLEEMWQVLGEPADFHVVEVGSGDGALARSIAGAAGSMARGFRNALRYVAADYAPVWPEAPTGARGPGRLIDRVKAEGLSPFRAIEGCILCNELLDNFPVHRFEVRGGRIQEIFVAVDGGRFVERLDSPSTPQLEHRLIESGVRLKDGTRGEVCLLLDDWIGDVARVLNRGFALTIDYGGRAQELYADTRPEGTLTCFREHEVGIDPYTDVGAQDITAHVDFSSVMRVGEARGMSTVGYARQADFLEALGFSRHLAMAAQQAPNDVLREFQRIAMSSLVDPEDTGDFRVLVQSKGLPAPVALRGFANQLER